MSKPPLLLHSCCAPCLTHPLAELQKSFEISLFFYNPNIHPRTEYEIRLAEAKRFCEKKCEIIEAEYEDEKWFESTKNLKNEPERGQRCKICYELRLRKTAEYAEKNSFPHFTTTLSISPHKNADWLNEIGENLAKEFDLNFFVADWKKQDGFKKSIALSHAAKLRRQNYCGCVYSQRKVS